MRDIIRHRRGAASLIAASAIWGLWNSGYKYAVSGLPITTVLAVMLLTATAALWAVVLIKGRGRVTSCQLRRIAVAGLLDPAISYAIGVLSAAGIALIGATRSVVWFSVWDLLVLAGVASAALCNVVTDRVLGDDLDPVTVTAYQMGFGALCVLPLAGWRDGT